MGLSDYRKYKREKELKESETVSFLMKRIDELEKRIADLENPDVEHVKVMSSYNNLSDEEKTKIKMAVDKQTKPEDFVKMFTGGEQEFNPNA